MDPSGAVSVDPTYNIPPGMLSAFTSVVCPALIHTVRTPCPDRFVGDDPLVGPCRLTVMVMPESVRAWRAVTWPVFAVAAAPAVATCRLPAAPSCLMTQTRKNKPPISQRKPENPVDSSAAGAAGTDTGALTGMVGASLICA